MARPTQPDRILAGPHAILEALANPHRSSLEEIWLDDTHRRQDIVEAARRAGVPLRRVSREELESLSPDTRHRGVVGLAGKYAYVDLDELLETSPAPMLVALDGITDPHNLGAVIRSAVAFGIDGLILAKRRAAHVTPAVVRVSAGATEHARIAIVTNIAQTAALLKERGLQVLGLAADGEQSIDKLLPAPDGRLLILGAEGSGLRRLVRERCDALVTIPMTGPLDSLNASVAAGIALYALSRQPRKE